MVEDDGHGGQRQIGRPYKFTVEQMIEALTASGGVVSGAAAWLANETGLGCTVQTVYKYIRDFPEVAAALPPIKEQTLDSAELGLIALIRRQNLTAIMYYLNNHGQGRGYNVRPPLYERREAYARAVAEAAAGAGAADEWNLDDLTDEEFDILERAFARQQGGGRAGAEPAAPEAGRGGGGSKPRPVH
jgi:hypothetical protein